MVAETDGLVCTTHCRTSWPGLCVAARPGPGLSATQGISLAEDSQWTSPGQVKKRPLEKKHAAGVNKHSCQSSGDDVIRSHKLLRILKAQLKTSDSAVFYWLAPWIITDLSLSSHNDCAVHLLHSPVGDSQCTPLDCRTLPYTASAVGTTGHWDSFTTSITLFCCMKRVWRSYCVDHGGDALWSSCWTTAGSGLRQTRSTWWSEKPAAVQEMTSRFEWSRNKTGNWLPVSLVQPLAEVPPSNSGAGQWLVTKWQRRREGEEGRKKAGKWTSCVTHSSGVQMLTQFYCDFRGEEEASD